MFQTDEIAFRRFTEDDLATFLRWRNDTDIARTDVLGPIKIVTDIEMHDWFQEYAVENPYSFAIVRTEDQTLIGQTGFKEVDQKNRNAEFFIVVGEKEQWGKGYAKQSLRLLLRYGFDELNLHRIWASVLGSNERALGLYRSLGFTVEGRRRQHVWRDGAWHDLVEIGILRSEFIVSDA